MTGAPYSDLSEPSRAVLAEVRRVVTAAKVAGRWATGPVPGTDRFDGAVGVDNDGHLTTYRTVEELHLAAVTRSVSARHPGLERR